MHCIHPVKILQPTEFLMSDIVITQTIGTGSRNQYLLCLVIILTFNGEVVNRAKSIIQLPHQYGNQMILNADKNFFGSHPRQLRETWQL